MVNDNQSTPETKPVDSWNRRDTSPEALAGLRAKLEAKLGEKALAAVEELDSDDQPAAA